MKTTFNNEAQKEFNRNNRKENHYQGEYMVLAIDEKTGEIAKKISCRFYGTQAKNYCCIWISRNEGYMTSGSGSAGGYGYDRQSAAAQEAIKNAGYRLMYDDGKSQSIAGVGQSAIQEALMAIAIEEGYNSPQIMQAHA